MTLHEEFMSQAISEANDAFQAGDFPVGCVFVHNNRIVSSGRRENSCGKVNEIDHAEMVALRNLYYSELRVLKMSEITVYSTMEPCLMCFSTLLVNGIRRFVYSYEDVMGGGTNLPINQLSPLYRDAEVSIVGGVLRSGSLELFKSFFANPENSYLRGSLLATYTLAQ
jgi:tRNA(adenine34) deaminase